MDGLLVFTDPLETMQDLLGMRLGILERFERHVTGDYVAILEHQIRRLGGFTSTLYSHGTAIIKWTAGCCYLNTPSNTRRSLACLHGIFKPADPHFRHRCNQ